MGTCRGMYLGVALLVPLLALTGANSAEDRARYEAELKELQEAIEELDQSLREAQGERSEVQEALEGIERELDQIARRVNQIEERIAEQRERVAALEADQAKARARLGEEREALAQEARIAYRQGRAQPFRILLSAEAPDQAARAMAYHAYFAELRTERIRRTSAALEGLVARQRQLEAERETLESLHSRLAEERHALKAQAASRNETLRELRRQIEGDRSARASLEEEAEQLENLLEGLGDVLVEGEFQMPAEDFANLQGALPWPVETERIAEQRRGGVLLPVSPGAVIHAVAPGRVVYANWLQGMGMLVIVDHGAGYMTLYGRNEALLREPGEWVRAGDRIALAAENPGPDGGRLHFEIRHEGEPVQAARWLTNR